MNFVAIPSCLKQHVLLFCNVKDLTRFRETSQSLHDDVQDTAKAILSAIVFKYYDDFPQRKQWLASASPLALLRNILEEKTYILRGLTLYALNMRTRTWKRCADCTRDHQFAGLLFKCGCLYATGAWGDQGAAIEKYNPLTDHWTAVAPFPPGFNHYTTVSHNEKIYLLAGNWPPALLGPGDHFYVLSTTNTGTEEWQPLNLQLPIAMMYLAGASFKRKIWIVGNMYGHLRTVQTYIYDSESGTLVPGPSVQCARLPGAVFTTSSAIYAVGGDWQEKLLLKCSDENECWESLEMQNAVSDLDFMDSAVHGERVTCLQQRVLQVLVQVIGATPHA